MGSHAGGTETAEERTRVCDLPEACVAHVIALTSPRDACRCAAVSPCFRDAAGSDVVWARFLPPDYLQLHQAPARRFPLSRSASTASAGAAASTKKETYLGLTDAAVLVDGGGMAVWLAKESGAKCVAISARRLSLPWDDGEFSWTWTPRLPTAALTPATAYTAYLVFTTEDTHRGLSFPDQETTVSVGGSAPSRHAVCLRPDPTDARRFRDSKGTDDVHVRGPVLRGDGWWEVEMGRLRTRDEAVVGEEVAVSFEILGWYPKRGLIVEGIEFRPI
ncbi:unnamed protein product [Triticum turgidum subsp. durum]|uniref:F-box domain-containing protein n=1 Tax=Triticum turgidum subsp. durum TaxID=4567 RepID=A0A9R1BQ52_TRITD|nr:unnamed protein product [Triticum turgidum subsp. durum]